MQGWATSDPLTLSVVMTMSAVVQPLRFKSQIPSATRYFLASVLSLLVWGLDGVGLGPGLNSRGSTLTATSGYHLGMQLR